MAKIKAIRNSASNAQCRNCQACEIKEKENLLLKQRIQDLEGVNESLKHELNENKSQV